MKTLVENLYQNRIPVNEGYELLFADEVYLPIYQSSLVITKRTFMPISLVEEKVLQLLDIEVYQIDEMAKILGLSRRLLEVTLADLYSKDLVAVSSNSCRILTLGIQALNSLNRSEKKQDILKDAYLDGLLGEIFDTSHYQLIDNVRTDDNKLKPFIPVGEVEYFIKRFKEVSEIFDVENKMVFSEGIYPIKEELLKIDKVETTFVKFVKIPINVFVSSNGVDIDIMSAKSKTNDLFTVYKDVILDQINHKKILKNHFKLKRIMDEYKGDKYPEKDELQEVLKKIHFNRNKQEIHYDVIEKQVLDSRKLSNGEYIEIIKHLVKAEEKVEIYLDSLENWVYDSTFTGALIEILDRKELVVYYSQSQNASKSLKQLKWSYSHIDKCEKFDSGYYICWKIGKYELYGIPTKRKVLNEDTTSVIVYYYLKNNSN